MTRAPPTPLPPPPSSRPAPENAQLAPTEPCFVLFAIEDEPSGEGAGQRHWLLMAWVPDAAAPRQKMLYSSSRDNFKKQLGAGFLSEGGEYCANCAEDVSWALYLQAQRKDGGGAPAPMTEHEILGREANLLEAQESAAGKAAAMQAVQFALEPPLAEALAAFAAAPPGALNWVEVWLTAGESAESVADEAQALCPSGAADGGRERRARRRAARRRARRRAPARGGGATPGARSRTRRPSRARRVSPPGRRAARRRPRASTRARSACSLSSRAPTSRRRASA